MIFLIADIAALTATALAAADGRFGVPLLVPFAVGGLALIFGLSAVDVFGFPHREGLGAYLQRLTAGFALAALAIGFLLCGFRPTVVRLEEYAFWFAISVIELTDLHMLWWAVVREWRIKGRLTPNIVVVGATSNAERLIEAAMNSGEAAVLGVFDDRAARNPAKVAGVPVLGGSEALLSHRIMPYVDRVVITVPTHAEARVRELIERLAVLPNQVMLFIDQGPAGEAAALSRIADAPLALVSGVAADERRALVKRAQDLVIGTLALAIAAPAMLAIALAIKLDSPGPIFFRQRRHGFNNEEILVWKFRSMRVDCADHCAARQVSADDDRVTRVGRLIRRTSLDELPQLFNVLKGEMSLVGPRPHAVGMKTGETESAKLVAGYAHRHRLKPGMTGWAAIRGSRGPVETAEKVSQRVALDVEYIERQSLMLDLAIMAMTIPCLLGDSQAVR
jgi:Undecaprenyl-phosphate glucose phosphotransferase